MPLTDVNQSGYDWHKHPHTKILLNARIRTLKPAHKGMLWMLMEYAALEVPFGSLENDAERLAEMAGVSLLAWSKSSDAVMGAAFVLCSDNRWYCQLLTDMLSSNVKQTDQDEPKQRSKSAERVARMRDRKRNAVTPDSAHVTPDVTHPSVTCNADVTPVTVTSVTNGGIKGGDLDRDLELDSDLNQNLKNIRAASQHTKDLIAKKFDVFWAAYPKKTDRKKAFAAFTKINPSDDLLQTMLSGIASWSSKWIAEPQYTPHPTTWLNGERWNDAQPVSTKPQASKPVTKSAGDVNSKWNVGTPQPVSAEALAEMEALQRRFAEEGC